MRANWKLLFLVLVCSLIISLIKGNSLSVAADNCTASGCHDKYLKEKNVHAPVRGRNCEKCHGGTDHPYPLIKKGGEVCSICHKMVTKKHAHPPVKDSECTQCHNPHASANEKLLKKSGNELCFECHDTAMFKNNVVHPPVSDSCLSCHDPHDSDYKKLLKEDGNKLCYTCHEPKDKEKVVHPPVQDDCLSCHNPHSTKAKSLLIKDGNELCLNCHERATYLGKKNVHPPVQEDCKNCHTPHSGKFTKLLKKENICIDCHGTMIEGKVVHPPVEGKECLSCHTPHTSDETKLKKAPLPKLCFECHDSGLFTKKYIHKPVKAECNLCHYPHSGNIEKLLLDKNEKLCERCHKELVSKSKSYIVPHPPVKDGQCKVCHNPHSSDVNKVLDDLPVFLCNRCHDLGDAKKAKSIHNPVEEGSCAACHGVHGGDRKKFLVKAFPDTNYVSYRPTQFELCFECHDKDLARYEKTVTVTEFRNGEKNLHFVHVNKDKGRNCKICHDPHMSLQEKLIKPAYKGFGKWDIPITFEKTFTGGGCIVGCHKPYYYDRLKPVKNK
ncbi:MAG: cytochrome c3 family protein [bacterium]